MAVDPPVRGGSPALSGRLGRKFSAWAALLSHGEEAPAAREREGTCLDRPCDTTVL